jgi:hypothetical protein
MTSFKEYLKEKKKIREENDILNSLTKEPKKKVKLPVYLYFRTKKQAIFK